MRFNRALKLAVASTLVWMTMLGAEVRVAGPGKAPQLVFACQLEDGPLQKMFADPAVIGDLRDLNAGVSLATITLSAQRAAVVRTLNQAGIPVLAGLTLPESAGFYANAGNEPQAAARFAQFESWTAQYGLRWSGIGLDIEPNIQEFGEARTGAWKIAGTLARRYFDFARVRRARQEYAGLIRRMQARGYVVDTYQFPFIADERRMHSTALERLAGLVDVRANREALMLYSSFSHGAGSALVWKYGPEAQLIIVGVVSNDAPVPGFFAPLDFEQLSNDLIVAAHFSRVVGVFSLEGCVEKGFLPRIRNIDWSTPVTISDPAIARVTRVRFIVGSALWILSWLPAILVGIAAVIIWMVRRRRRTRAA